MRNLLRFAVGFNSINYVVGPMLILVGLLVIGGGEVAIKATPESEAVWITSLAKLPTWIGWVLIWFGFDTFFNGKLSKLIIDKIIGPVAGQILQNIIGEERLNKIKNFRARFSGKGGNKEEVEPK